MLRRMGIAGLLVLPATLTIYLGFNAGGFFPGQPALVALFLALLLVMVTTLSEEPFAGLGATLGLAIGALALLALWTLFSGSWSGSSARALTEFGRVLPYVLALVAFSALATSHQRLRWLTRSVAAGVLVVAAAGLITRVLPDVWHVAPTVQAQRLSFPVTYWNSLGLVAAIGIVLCFALTGDDQEPPAGRVLSAAAIPLLAVTLLFTFSRGAMAVAVIALVAVLLVGRPRLALTGLVAVVPPTAIALVVAYHADQLATATPIRAQAIAQGHRVALVVAGCVVLAALLRPVLLLADAPLARYRLPEHYQRLRVPVAAGTVMVLVVVALAAGAPHAIADQYERFIQGDVVKTSRHDFRQRLTQVGNNGRRQLWDVALQGFATEPLRGQGAATYELYWAQHRPVKAFVRNAHSLYFEVADELGIVGLVLLGLAVLTLLGGSLWRARGIDRTLYAAVFAALLAWAIEAGFDWQWQMPAVTLPVLVLTGAAVAAKVPVGTTRPLPRGTRVVLSVGWLVLAVAPALIAISDGRIAQAATAFNRYDDCRTAVRASVASMSALANRPQPYEILGYCDLERGFPVSAIQAMRRAVQRDPDNWRYRYGLSVAQGEAGLDPRPQARAALALDPREEIVRQAAASLGADSRRWRFEARQNRNDLVSTGFVGTR